MQFDKQAHMGGFVSHEFGCDSADVWDQRRQASLYSLQQAPDDGWIVGLCAS